MTFLIGESFPEMRRNLLLCRHPDILLRDDIPHEFLDCFSATRFATNTAMERNSHHPWVPFLPFGVQRIECILQILRKCANGAPAMRITVFKVIAVTSGASLLVR